MERFERVDPFVFLMWRDNFQFKALKTKKISPCSVQIMRIARNSFFLAETVSRDRLLINIYRYTRSPVLRTHFKHYVTHLACFAVRITSYQSNSRVQHGHFPTVDTLPSWFKCAWTCFRYRKDTLQKNHYFLLSYFLRHVDTIRRTLSILFNVQLIPFAIVINS